MSILQPFKMAWRSIVGKKGRSKPIDVSNNNSPDAVDYRCGIFAERYARRSLWQLSSS